MEFIIHEKGNSKIAELKATNTILKNTGDFLDLIGNANYQGVEKIIIRKENLQADFFDLKTRIAGDILQKFSTYNLRLAIIGDFSAYQSKALNDFIRESNKIGRILFLSKKEEAIERFWKN